MLNQEPQKPERHLERSLETLADPGDDELALVLLDCWSDDLGDVIIGAPHPDGYHPAPAFPGDKESVRPHGYAGYGFIFVKGAHYITIVIPKLALSKVATESAARVLWEQRIRSAWEQLWRSKRSDEHQEHHPKPS